MKRIKAFLFYITPRVYNLRDCIYIRWMNKDYSRGTQDWQIDAYEMRGRHNSMIRHQRTINEMNNQPTKWGVNMSEVKR